MRRFRDCRFFAAMVVVVLGTYWWLLGHSWVFDWCGLSLVAGQWFGDTWAVLAASDMAAAGRDPFSVAHQVGFIHVYPRTWFGLAALGITRGDFLSVGLVVVGIFMATCFLWLRPRSWGEVAMAVLLLISPAFALGFNRANVDLVLCPLMLLLALVLASESALVRRTGPALVIVGTLLKFYPLVAGGALLGGERSRRERWGQWAVLGSLAVLVAAPLWVDYQKIAARVPNTPGFYMFGATSRPWESPWWGGLAWLAVALAAWAGWRGGRGADRVNSARERREEMAFLVGAFLLVGCFFAGVSYVYRFVFLVLMFPWLWREGRRGRRGARIVAWGAVGLTWLDATGVLFMAGCLLHGRAQMAQMILDESAWVRLPLQWVWVGGLVWLLAQRLRAAEAERN